MVRTGAALCAAGLLAAGCHGRMGTGETIHETASIDLDKSEMARVEIRMGAGELRVTSGTPKLVDASFAFNIPELRPEVQYRAGSTRGDLTIVQPRSSTLMLGHVVYSWDLKLNEQRPLDVNAHLGAGEADLQLGRMNLQRVEVHIGAGEVKLDLRGEPKRDYDVELHGGVGEATVYLPKDVAVSATAKGVLGSVSASGLEKRNGVWVNPDRPQGPVTVRVDARGAIGEIHLIR